MKTDQAFQLVKKAGITKSKQTFLRYVREGKIKGMIEYKREGYTFDEGDIRRFIEKNKKETEPNILADYHTLKEKNEQLKYQLKIPRDVYHAENLKLREKIEALEEEIKKLKMNKK